MTSFRAPILTRLTVAAAMLSLAGVARADSPHLPPMPKSLDELRQSTRPTDAPPSMEAYGAVNSACQEWSDGCQTCRAADGPADKPACSTVAIACKRAQPVCVHPKP
jgi:hypothetical protein